MYDTILLPIDGSDGTENVANHASELAGCHGAEIHLLYVIDSRAYSILPEDSISGIRREVSTEGEDLLEEIEELEALEHTPTEKFLSEGVPHEVITNYAIEKDIDVIVMGTHGRTGKLRQKVGSVAERVVRFAPIPTVVVPLANGDDEEIEDIRGFQ